MHSTLKGAPMKYTIFSKKPPIECYMALKVITNTPNFSPLYDTYGKFYGEVDRETFSIRPHMHGHLIPNKNKSPKINVTFTEKDGGTKINVEIKPPESILAFIGILALAVCFGVRDIVSGIISSNTAKIFSGLSVAVSFTIILLLLFFFGLRRPIKRSINTLNEIFT